MSVTEEFDEKMDAVKAKWRTFEKGRVYRYTEILWLAGFVLSLPCAMVLRIRYGQYDLHATLCLLAGIILIQPWGYVVLWQGLGRMRDVRRLQRELETIRIVSREILRFHAPAEYEKLRKREKFEAVLERGQK